MKQIKTRLMKLFEWAVQEQQAALQLNQHLVRWLLFEPGRAKGQCSAIDAAGKGRLLALELTQKEDSLLARRKREGALIGRYFIFFFRCGTTRDETTFIQRFRRI